MARITVDDCLQNVTNRFELVLIASKRARQLARGGADPLVAIEGDKPTVIALREIAENLLNKEPSKEDRKQSQTLKTEPKDASGNEISQEVIDETQQVQVDFATEDEPSLQVTTELDTVNFEPPESE